jgi:hypothetical protein
MPARAEPPTRPPPGGLPATRQPVTGLYPCSRVRVLTGAGAGTLRIPGGLPVPFPGWDTSLTGSLCPSRVYTGPRIILSPFSRPYEMAQPAALLDGWHAHAQGAVSSRGQFCARSSPLFLPHRSQRSSSNRRTAASLRGIQHRLPPVPVSLEGIKGSPSGGR